VCFAPQEITGFYLGGAVGTHPPSQILAAFKLLVPQNAPEAIYESVKYKHFLEQHSQVQYLRVHQNQSKRV